MWIIFSVFSVKTSKAGGVVWLAPACFTQAFNSNDLLSEWQTQQMLTLSNAKCLSSPPCFCPVMALRRGERPGHLTLRDSVCLRVCMWASVNVHVYVTNRPASGVPYQAGPMLTSILSTSSPVYPSAVAGHSENLICATAGKVNNYNSCFDIC